MSNPRSFISKMSSSYLLITSSITTVPEKSPSIGTQVDVSEEVMLFLISYGITPDIGHIIMAYATPSLRNAAPFTSSNPRQYFTSRVPYTCFYHNFSDLAEIDQHCIWGRPEEVTRILKEMITKSIRDKDYLLPIKSLLTRNIDGEDHRGPGFIPSGTLLERVLYVGDVMLGDERGETMARQLELIVSRICGKEEFKKQIERAREVLEEDSKKKAFIEKSDKKALEKVWDVLKNADDKTVKSNLELKQAWEEFENQLKKPGNENIIKEAETYFDRDYLNFGGFDTPKNNFAKNKIIGIAQLRRLSVCDLQIYFAGLNKFFTTFYIQRIDVRHELGVLPTSNVALFLGNNCHLDIFAGCMTKCEFVPLSLSACEVIEKVSKAKNKALQEIMEQFVDRSNNKVNIKPHV